MVYTKLTAKAMRIAVRAHKNQYDKNEFPYIHHPLHIAEQMNTEIATAVALLHDVLEDSKYTYEDLIADGIPKEVADIVLLLTKSDDKTYMEYIENLKDSRVACIVKRADLLHNMDPTRRQPNDIEEKYISRQKRYAKALEKIESYLNTSD